MFLFQHPEEYIRSLEAERERKELRSRLLRELRGATPPFGEAQTRRLAAALAAESGDRESARQGNRAAAPCPEAKEAMST
jgi:hypothetical protein